MLFSSFFMSLRVFTLITVYYTIHDDYTICNYPANKMQSVNPPTKVKVRDIPPTGVRLDQELKKHLVREANINGRSLHAEINVRLQASMDADLGREAHRDLSLVREPVAGWPLTGLSEAERVLLGQYKKLSPEKQLALHSLLK